MDTMNRIISKANILVNTLNYSKWRDIITNVLLKDHLYEVDVELELVVAKFVAQTTNAMASLRGSKLSWSIIVTTLHKSEKKETTLLYLPTNVVEQAQE